jgi:hypothetical protein
VHAALYLNAVSLLGADAALAKPICFDKLVRAVTDLLNDSQRYGLAGKKLVLRPVE